MAKLMKNDGPENPESQQEVSPMDDHQRHVELHQKLRKEAGIGPLTKGEAKQLEALLNDPEYLAWHAWPPASPASAGSRAVPIEAEK